jgi:hypothetical protein
MAAMAVNSALSAISYDISEKRVEALRKRCVRTVEQSLRGRQPEMAICTEESARVGMDRVT